MAISDQDKIILHFLKKHHVGVLSTVDEHCRPHATVIYYEAKEDFSIVFLTKSGTQKYFNLSRHPAACLLVYDELNQIVAQVAGIAKTAPSNFQESFVRSLKSALETSESGVPPIAKLMAGEYVVYTITPSSVRLADFSRPGRGSYDKMMKSVAAIAHSPHSSEPRRASRTARS